MCVFSVPFLNTIGIVKYLEGGVFIHTDFTVVVKNNDAKNKQSAKRCCIVPGAFAYFDGGDEME